MNIQRHLVVSLTRVKSFIPMCDMVMGLVFLFALALANPHGRISLLVDVLFLCITVLLTLRTVTSLWFGKMILPVIGGSLMYAAGGSVFYMSGVGGPPYGLIVSLFTGYLFLSGSVSFVSFTIKATGKPREIRKARAEGLLRNFKETVSAFGK